MAKSRKTRRQPSPPRKKPAASRRVIAWRVANSALAIAVLGIVSPIIISHFSSHSRDPQRSAAPRIEVDDVQVQDDNTGDSKTGSALVTVMLRNTGNQIAIIKSATFRIRRSAVLPQCLSQGSLATSGTYPVTLPPDPRPGAVVPASISQQEPPDSADRFSFRLGLPGGPLEGISFYEMTMTLAYDNVRLPVNAGSLLVSLPSDPDSQYVWTKTDESTHMAGQAATASQAAGTSHCLVGNSTAIRAMLSSPAARSEGVVNVQSQIAYCCVLTDPGAGKEG
jgi:hypothetical protein